MADMARAGGIDVLTGDYLAEVTMLILGKARAKDSSTGYATTFLDHLDAALDDLVANGIRLVVNAGGLNPAGLADATRELVARRGHDLRVSFVDGDDVFDRLDALQHAGHALPHLTSGEPLSSWPHRPLTANAYLGGFGIARALEPRRRHRRHRPRRGRLPGRRSGRLVVGLDPVRLRRPGRCGRRRARHRVRAPGDRRQLLRVPSIPDLEQPGFPIAEIAADGSVGDHQEPGDRRRGHRGHGQRPTALRDRRPRLSQPRRGHPPRHRQRSPTSATTASQIRGVRGSAPPPTTKVAITGVGGWQNSVLLALTGTDLDGKAALVERAVHAYAEAVDGIGEVAVDRIGAARDDPDSQHAGTQLLGSRCRARGRPPGGRSRRTSSSWPCPATPGCTPSARRNRGRRSAPTGRRCSNSGCSTTRSTTTTAPPRSSSPAIRTGGEDAAIRPPRRRRHRSRAVDAATWSSSRSVRSCTPARATRAATRISVSGYATGARGTGSTRA